MAKTTIITFLLIATSQIVSSQNDSIKNNVWNNLKYDGTSFVKGFVNTFTQPTRWKNKDLLTAAYIIGGSSILYLADTEANDFFQRQGQHAPGVLKDFGRYFGKPQNFFVVSAGIYGFGLISNNVKVRYTGVLIVTSAASAGLIQSVSKTVFGRARPSKGDKDEFRFYSDGAGYHSFPSGHSVLSFAIAHAVAKQFKNIWIKSGIYAIGSISPISRLWDNAHWLSDVGAGIALSIVVVDGVDNFLRKKQRYGLEEKKKISWRFTAGHKTIGIVGSF